MKARILVHSTSGNTRLVVDYAAARLAKAGLACEITTIRHQADRPEIDGVDVLGVAFPVMYFRPTLVIERVVEGLPTPKAGTPAFVLATAGGDTGAAMHLMVEQLERKGFRVVGAHWIKAPSNWPPQLSVTRQPRRIPGVPALQDGLGRLLQPFWEQSMGRRRLAGLVWESATETSETDREALDRHLDSLVGALYALQGGARPAPLSLDEFGTAATRWFGRAIDVSRPASKSGLRVVPEACTRCGACVRACPADCVQADEAGLPHFSPQGCTGCWACYNACTHSAIAATATTPGLGRYAGPSAAMRDLLAP